MRNILLIILFGCIASAARAQGYYYFDRTEVALKTVYGDDGEVIGAQEYSVLEGNPSRVLGQNVITKPGKKSETTSCRYICSDGRLLIAMGRNKDGEEVFLDYYGGMAPGCAIVEGIEFETQAKLAGMKLNLTCTISDRAVTATGETISSKLGEWACVKTEYDMELRSRIFGIPVNVHVIEWFAPGVGVVRTDVFRRGKLHERRLLTGFRPAGSEAGAESLAIN